MSVSMQPLFYPKEGIKQNPYYPSKNYGDVEDGHHAHQFFYLAMEPDEAISRFFVEGKLP